MAAFDSAKFDQAKFDVRDQAAADTLSLSDALGASLKRLLPSDAFGLGDALTRQARPATADAAALADVLQAKAALARTEALAIADALLKRITRGAVSDALALADAGTGRTLTMFVDAVALADASLALVQAMQGDAAALADLLACRTMRPVADATWMRDEANLTPNIGPWSESMEDCSGYLQGNPALTNGQNALNVGGQWKAALRYSDPSAYCEVRTDDGRYGAAYFRVMDDATHTWKAFLAGTAITLVAGKWYRASVYARSSAIRGSMGYAIYSSGETRLRPTITWGVTALGPSKGWVRGEVRFQVPADAASTTGAPYLYGHINANGTVAEVDYDGYRLEGPFDADPGPLDDSPALTVGKAMADSATLADALATAVGAYRGDLLALADSTAAAIGASPADALQLVEAVAAAVALAGPSEGAAVADALLRRYAPAAATDALALADSSAAQAAAQSIPDTAALAEALVAAIQPRLDDLAAVADAIQARAAAMQADAAAAADSVSSAAAYHRVFADLATLVDAITATIQAGLPPPALFGEGTFGQAAFDDVPGTERAPLADELGITAGFGLIAEDLVALADAITGRGGKVPAESAGLAEAVGSRVGKTGGNDAAGAGDVITAKPSVSPSPDALPVGDATSAAVAMSTADAGSVADALAKKASVAAVDAAILADALAGVVAALRGDTTGAADALAATWAAGRAIDDAAAATDAITTAVGTIVADALSVLDDLRAAAMAGRSDAVGATDVVSLLARVSLADTIYLADGLARTATALARETVSLADGHTARAGSGVADTVVTSDILAVAGGKLLADLAPLVEALGVEVRATWGEAEGVADVLATALAIVKGAVETIAAADDIAKTIKAQAQEAAVLAESQALTPHVAMADANTLTDEYTSMPGKAADDLLSVADALLHAVAASLTSSAALADLLAATARTGATDNASLIETVLVGAAPLIAEALGVSDAVVRAAIQAGGLQSVLALAELLAARDQVPLTEAQPVADALVAALLMARQADDLLAAADAAQWTARKALDELLATSDDSWMAMQAARAEAVSLAEVLGVAAGKPLPDDAVGVIDEAALRAALGLAAVPVWLADSISGRTITVLQQVFIAGVQVPVTGLSIKHSAGDRVSSCSFRIPSPSPEVLALARQRAEVRLYLADGGITDYFAGRIVGNPVSARSTVATELQITADDWTAAAHDVYVSEIYTAAGGTLDQVVRNLWARYYGYPVDLTQVVATAKTVDFIAFNYDTLFDATEKLAQLLGWSWYAEWDGAQRVLRFFPPSAAVKPVTLSRENRNLAAGSARFGQDDQLANSVYVFGGDGMSDPFTERITADGQKVIYSLGSKPYRVSDDPAGGVSVAVGGAAQTVGILNLHDPAAFAVLMDFEGKALHWRDDNKPASGALIECTYRYAYPIVVHLTDDDSIATFGPAEAVIQDSKIRDVRSARDAGRAKLRDAAWPSGYGSCEVFAPGLRAGDFVTVDLAAYNARGLYEIVEIEKRVEAGVVRRRVTLNVADDAESRIAARLRDFAARLASLEAGQRPDDVMVQRILRGPANLAVAASGYAAGAIYEQGDSAADLGDAAIRTWRRAGAASAYADMEAGAADSAAMRPRVLRADAGGAAELAVVGITFFDRHTFGDPLHPFGEVVAS